MIVAVISIINSILRFFNEWVNVLLILVGFLALVTYILQERKKVTDAASLVILQIDELQDRIKEIQSYIVNGQLNATAFYESQLLFGDNYWNQYKHYFVKKVDPKSFRTLNIFYEYASEIQEQQQLMKNLQKNSFFITQQLLAYLEANYIVSGLSNSTSFPEDVQQIIAGLEKTILQNFESEQKQAFENMILKCVASNNNIDFTAFWKSYNQNRSNIRTVIDQNGLTSYTPIQISLSIEKALSQYALLEVTGCDGYKKLEKISKRWF